MGPSLPEITAIAAAMDNCVRIDPDVDEELMDTCAQAAG